MAETFTRELTNAIILRIYHALQAAGDTGLTRTQIYRDVCGHHVAHEVISEALYWDLHLNNLAYWNEESGKGGKGRPVERWYAVPFGPMESWYVEKYTEKTNDNK